MQFVNLTPHEINVYRPSDVQLTGFNSYVPNPGAAPIDTIRPSGVEARALTGEESVGYDLLPGGVRIERVKMTYSDPIGLPPYDVDKICIVSALTANAALAAKEKAEKNGLPFRPVDDLRIPSGSVRDANGRVIGCIKLAIVG